MLHTVVMGAQQCFRGPSSLPHGTLLFAIFLSCAYGRRKICSAAEAERLRCTACSSSMAGGSEQEPHCTQRE